MNKDTGKLIRRREALVRTAGYVALVGLGAKGVKQVFAQSTNSAIATPELTEGPYWVDEQLNRSDLVVDPSDNTLQAGFPLVLGVTVSQLQNGQVAPLSGAYVDLWHANALGVYSDIAAEGTSGKKFLRGYQVTDAHGAVRFLTVYPGWYTGRTPHIHARVRLYSGGSTTENFTTQFFFNESITDSVYQLSPYNTRPNRDTTNAVDGIYTTLDCATQVASGGELLLRLAQDSSHAIGSFNIILDLSGNACSSTGGGGAPPSGPTGGPGTPPPGGPGAPPGA